MHDTLSARLDPSGEKPLLAYDYAVWVDSDLLFHDTSRGVSELLREFSPYPLGASGLGASACARECNGWSSPLRGLRKGCFLSLPSRT